MEKGKKHFKDMETAFGVKHKHDNLSDQEKNQFGDMEEVEGQISEFSKEEPKTNTALKGVKKTSGSDAQEYYKSVVDKMVNFQKMNTEKKSEDKKLKKEQADNAVTFLFETDIEPKKRNWEEEEDFEYNGHMGTGMSGLRYDDEHTENYEQFEERNDELNDEDDTYKKLKDYGKKYKDYKYGKEKFKKSEDEYKETPRVRVTTTENTFKSKGKLVSEQQVLKLANKVPNRVKIDETKFNITDGENEYKLMWEGDDKTGEPIILHMKNEKLVNESIDKMKHLWGYNSKDTISTKKTIKENNDDISKTLFKKFKRNENN